MALRACLCWLSKAPIKLRAEHKWSVPHEIRLSSVIWQKAVLFSLEMLHQAVSTTRLARQRSGVSGAPMEYSSRARSHHDALDSARADPPPSPAISLDLCVEQWLPKQGKGDNPRAQKLSSARACDQACPCRPITQCHSTGTWIAGEIEFEAQVASCHSSLFSPCFTNDVWR